MNTPRNRGTSVSAMTARRRLLAGAEPLEPRRALAGLFTFTDVDGDAVTVTTSLGTNALLASAVQLKSIGTGSQLTGISLKNPAFTGTTLSIIAAAKGGDGLVNVGKIDASGRDLGGVTVAGDLAAIVAGDANMATPGLTSLHVRSLGRMGLSTGATDLQSTVAGTLQTLHVDGSIVAASLNAAAIGTAVVGGSIVGSSAPHSGEIACSGTIGNVLVKRDIVGGAGQSSGLVSAADITKVTVLGNVIGAAGEDSGGIHASGKLGPVDISKDIVGGLGAGSGHMEGETSIAGVRVRNLLGGDGLSSGHVSSPSKVGPLPILFKGSIVGGSGNASGSIEIDSVLNQVHVAGSITGGGGATSGSVVAFALMNLEVGKDVRGGRGNDSGTVAAIGGIGTAVVGGSVSGGAGTGAGRIESLGSSIAKVIATKGIAGGTGAGSGSIRAATTIGSVTVKQSVMGGDGDGSGTIAAHGTIAAVTIAADLAGGAGAGSGAIVSDDRVNSVTVGGSIRGGSADSSGAVRAGLSLGSLTVKGAVVGTASHPVLITAMGSDAVMALPAIAVAGRLEAATILAGYSNDPIPKPVASVAAIGTVSVGGNLVGSSIVAGAKNGDFPNFGTVADVPASPSTPSKIGTVVLGGVLETPISTDHFGIVATGIGSVTVAKQKVALPAPGGLVSLAGASDVTIRRIG